MTGTPRTTIFIENKSNLPLTLISPCGDVASPSGVRIGFLDAGLHDLPTGGDGSTCGQNVTLGPMEMARANVHFHDIDPDLPAGDHTFTTVFGAVHVTGVDPIDPPAGMVGWWPGDGNALDIIGGNHGTLTGDFAPGKVGQGFSLDGTGDFVLVPDNPNLNITGDVTVDLWARRTRFDGNIAVVSVMFGKGGDHIGTGDAADDYVFDFITGDLLLAGFGRADGSVAALAGPTVTDSAFHHYAYVRSGDTHKLYMDGVVATIITFEVLADGTLLTGDRFKPLTISPGDTSGFPLVIGAFRDDSEPTGFCCHFGGVIDEVEIFDRALSDAEIRAIFDAGSAGKIKGFVFNPANGHRYQAVSVPGGISWTDAKTAAESRTFAGVQGHLATIASQAENDFIRGNFLTAIRVDEYWIGGFQPPGSPEPGGNWQWVTGETFSFTDWGPGEPNDNFGAGEDGLHFFNDASPPQWNDLTRNSTRPQGYIVEYDTVQ